MLLTLVRVLLCGRVVIAVRLARLRFFLMANRHRCRWHGEREEHQQGKETNDH